MQPYNTQKFEVKDHVPSILPEGRWKMVWHDEFDGTALDRSKWDTRLYMMGRRAEHWVEDAFELDGKSNIIFRIEKRNGIYCSTQLQTGYNFMDLPGVEYDFAANENKKVENEVVNYFQWPIGEIKKPKFMHRYGYYECRCKMQEKEGWWSAFWLQSPVIGATMNPEESGVEVDIMEQFWRTAREPHHIVSSNNHWNGYGAQYETTGEQWASLRETEDGYHTFGLEWTPEAYYYFVDGMLVRTIRAPLPVSQREQFILLTTEVTGYRNSWCRDWSAQEEAVAAGDRWIVDYVRVFDRVPEK